MRGLLKKDTRTRLKKYDLSCGQRLASCNLRFTVTVSTIS
nr:MAG TPA: hypothetical protein [Caudoviricetes sp.]